MATTVQELKAILDEEEVRYREREDGALVSSWTTKHYTDGDGDKALIIVVELDENGEYIKIFAPGAYKAVGPHQDAFLRACSMIQWRTKLIQFEWDETDGEIRPVVEFPIEDSNLTKNQLMRCIIGICRILDDFHPALERALKEGVVELPERPGARIIPSGQPQVTMIEVLLHSLLEQGKSETDPAVQSARALLAQLKGEGEAPTEF